MIMRRGDEISSMRWLRLARCHTYRSTAVAPMAGDGESYIDLSRREFADIPVINLHLPQEQLVADLAAACEHPVR